MTLPTLEEFRLYRIFDLFFHVDWGTALSLTLIEEVTERSLLLSDGLQNKDTVSHFSQSTRREGTGRGVAASGPRCRRGLPGGGHIVTASGGIFQMRGAGVAAGGREEGRAQNAK